MLSPDNLHSICSSMNIQSNRATHDKRVIGENL